ncbi:sensor histidine kinase [Paenibacillus senegalimassiliensis]|uniref:sensor histidine kinase n=1 Tax=Paenibacillus senegalimassiliensis TaxID=1737426 RepID=UPI00073E60E9|nr:sensor histidine kinase [Paenibacillus senegalimassiliensis]
MTGYSWLPWLLLIPLILFALLYWHERRMAQTLRRELSYVHKKLLPFTNPREPLTQERILTVTALPELRELLQTINALLDRAGQSAADYAGTERAMRMMLSNVSHDLKTPLTVIMGYAEMLSQQPELPEEEQQRMLGEIHRKTVQVHQLINTFFDLARLESGDLDIPLSVIDAGEVSRQRILAYFDLLSEQGFQVDIQLPEHPVWVYANAEALSRILDNLLSNAMRYGAEGHYLGLLLEEDKKEIHIQVIDRGRGISSKEQARVFERMYTMEDSRNRNMQGSGLGLTIAKRLTERLNGRLGLESTPGVRTCFTITLIRSERAT